MIRVSSSYFSDNPFFDDGCYFLVDGEWMQRWRSWLHRKLPYEDIGPMRFLSLCPHGGLLIPGYMDHFILGKSPVPCAVDIWERMNDRQ